VRVKPVLQPEQHLSRLTPLPAPNDVAEVVESFDAGSGDDQRLGRRVVMRGELRGQLDIAFIDGPTDPAKLTRTEIGHDNLALAVPHDDPTTKRASIDLADPALRDRDFAELVQHGLGISILPPASVRAVTPATRPPTGPAQALLDLLLVDISSRLD
jgi:hypothetical protein